MGNRYLLISRTLLLQELVQVCLRIHKILFFGQEFLCGLETPVLKLQKSETGVSEYVSVVEASSVSTPGSPPEQVSLSPTPASPAQSCGRLVNFASLTAGQISARVARMIAVSAMTASFLDLFHGVHC